MENRGMWWTRPVHNRYRSYVALGDSFTEGVGDELPDGRVRGWADLVALGLAAASEEPVRYANLAIRGRLLGPIVDEQLDPAIALGADLLSFNGGGNDILRPRVSISAIADRIEAAVDRAVTGGSHVVLATGANPTRHIPLGSVFQARGDLLADAVRDRLPKAGVTLVDNWADTELADIRFWSNDKLHLNATGHRRVAGNVLAALQIPIADAATGGGGSAGADAGAASRTGVGAGGGTWPGADDPAVVDEARERTAAYWRRYVLPWIGRRLTGRSSGDGRSPKFPTLDVVRLDR